MCAVYGWAWLNKKEIGYTPQARSTVPPYICNSLAVYVVEILVSMAGFEVEYVQQNKSVSKWMYIFQKGWQIYIQTEGTNGWINKAYIINGTTSIYQPTIHRPPIHWTPIYRLPIYRRYIDRRYIDPQIHRPPIHRPPIHRPMYWPNFITSTPTINRLQ
jgi:hypothetical protein